MEEQSKVYEEHITDLKIQLNEVDENTRGKYEE